jgi:hypothetical protein
MSGVDAETQKAKIYALMQACATEEDDDEFEGLVDELVDETLNLPNMDDCWKRGAHGALYRLSRGKATGTNWLRDHHSDGCVRCGDENAIIDAQRVEGDDPVLCVDCDEHVSAGEIEPKCEGCGFVHELQPKLCVFSSLAKLACYTLPKYSKNSTPLGRKLLSAALKIFNWPEDEQSILQLVEDSSMLTFPGPVDECEDAWVVYTDRYGLDCDPLLASSANALFTLASHPAVCPKSFYAPQKACAMSGFDNEEKYGEVMPFAWI